MSLEPLKSLGFWRGKEMAVESFLPITISGFCIWKVKGLTSAIAVGKPLTMTELYVFFGALVAVVSWAMSRQVYLMGRRKPSWIAFFSCILSLMIVYVLSNLATSGFSYSCTDIYKGTVISAHEFWGAKKELVCQVGGISGNGYLPGTLLRPVWDGQITVPMWIFFSFVSLCAAVSFRDRRFISTSMILRLYKLLEYASATGVEGCLGGKPKNGQVYACSNPTLWGEICGQLYSGDYEFEPGEWCGRCGQPFVKAERSLTFNVLSLFTDNIDLLNMLEKKDTLSWDVTESGKMPADGRQSNVERWVVLGQVTVPDVVSVAQLLSIIHFHFPIWSAGDERIKDTIDLAKKRSSKLYGWIWFGNMSKRLTYAKPTNKVLMAMGTTRLRDLITDSGETLNFQLDVGLLPVEMRSAFHMSFVDKEPEEDRYQNSKYDIWLPIGPKLAANFAGLWVPRVEGDALRKWLSVGRLQKKGKRGVTSPKPYYLNMEKLEEEMIFLPEAPEEFDVEEVGNVVEEIEEEADHISRFFEVEKEEEEGSSFLPFFEETDSEEEIPSEDTDVVIHKPEPVAVEQETYEDKKIPVPEVKEGSLDIVVTPYYDQYETEPKLSAVGLGDSIAEWEWLEPEQIQRLRQQCLVLVDMNAHRK
ncbi:MAG: hypothetical protein CL916_01455 [Deltaproteobacteria bacterium]|nr:hypothetical protein [Deltaproteobacteria bacterium]